MWKPIFANETQDLPLCQAICDGNRTEIERLLSDPTTNLNESDTDGQTACHKAIIRKDLKTLQELIEKGADIELCTWEGATPLHFAVAYDETGEITKALLRAGAQLNPFTMGEYWTINVTTTPLDKAIVLKNGVVAELLLQAGARICSTTPEKFKEFVQPLVDRGSISVSQSEQSGILVKEEALSRNPFRYGE